MAVFPVFSIYLLYTATFYLVSLVSAVYHASVSGLCDRTFAWTIYWSVCLQSVLWQNG